MMTATLLAGAAFCVLGKFILLVAQLHAFDRNWPKAIVSYIDGGLSMALGYALVFVTITGALS